MKTLRLNYLQATLVEQAMRRQMRDHENHAAEEFGSSVHESPIVRDGALGYMRTALDFMRECHEVRQRLLAPSRPRRSRRTH